MQCLCLSKLVNRVQFGCNLHLQASSKCSLLRCKPDFGATSEDIYLCCLCGIYHPQGWLMFHTIGGISGTCTFFIDRTEEWTVFANLSWEMIKVLFCVDSWQDEAHRYEDLSWWNVVFRVHFFDFESPAGVKYSIWGLTASVLIRAASIILQCEPAFIEASPCLEDFSIKKGDL